MRIVLAIALFLTAGCRSGTLESGEWGTLRYFGELEGVIPLNDTEDDLQLPLVMIPPTSDRDGNIYVLHERDTKDSAVYVGNPYGGWSPGCRAGDSQLPQASAQDASLRGFLGTSQSMAWYWAGDSLVQVSGKTGECKQVMDRDPLTLSDLAFVAAVPYVHETPARRTLNAWVQSTNSAANREPPYQVVVDLDLRRYVTYSPFEPSEATCVDILGVGANPDHEEGVVVVAYNWNGSRVQEARFMDAHGNNTGIATLDMGISEVFVCEGDSDRPEPLIVGQLQGNDQGIYAGLLDNGELLSFTSSSGSSKALPNFAVEGMAKIDGSLWVTGTADGGPVVGAVTGIGNVGGVIRWESSKRAADNLVGSIKVLDERYSPAEPVSWPSPVTAIGTWPFMSPFPLDNYAVDTTGWVVAGPSFESVTVRTAVAFGPVGISVP